MLGNDLHVGSTVCIKQIIVVIKTGQCEDKELVMWPPQTRLRRVLAHGQMVEDSQKTFGRFIYLLNSFLNCVWWPKHLVQ